MSFLELQGRATFVLSLNDTSLENIVLVQREAIWLDGTLVTADGHEWEGAGAIAGIIYGPARTSSGPRKVTLVAREAEVERAYIVFPEGFEAAAASGLAALDIVVRPAIEGATETGIDGAGTLGKIVGAAVMNPPEEDGSTLTAADSGSSFNGWATDTFTYSGVDQDYGTLEPDIPELWQVATTNSGSNALVVYIRGDHVSDQASISVTIDGTTYEGADAYSFTLLGVGPSASTQGIWIGVTEFEIGSTHTIVFTA